MSDQQVARLQNGGQPFAAVADNIVVVQPFVEPVVVLFVVVIRTSFETLAANSALNGFELEGVRRTNRYMQSTFL